MSAPGVGGHLPQQQPIPGSLNQLLQRKYVTLSVISLRACNLHKLVYIPQPEAANQGTTTANEQTQYNGFAFHKQSGTDMNRQPQDDAMSGETAVDMGNVGSHTDAPKVEDTQHRKQKYTISPRIVSDAILGLSDGLTVPFALTAGLSTLGTSRLVVLGGLAELMAGAISMGLGGFVGAKSEAESYQATSRQCDSQMKYSPNEICKIIQTHFQQYSLCPKSIEIIQHALTNSPVQLKDFLMKHHFGIVEPPDNRPYISALTLGIAYILGGIIPLLPYFFISNVDKALFVSIGLMAFVLLVFGYAKTGVVRGWSGQANVLAGVKGSAQMLIVGAVAAGAAIGLVRAVNSAGHLS